MTTAGALWAGGRALLAVPGASSTSGGLTADSLPVPVSASFHERLLALNALQLAGLIEWLFHPAMLYRATRKWWGDGGGRDSPHEGLDFQSYRTAQGAIRYLNEKTLVPPVFSGRIVRIIDDFLGKSVFVRHGFQSPSGRLYTVYGHIVPGPGISEGADIDIETAVGMLAVGGSVPSHLHISVAWVSDAIPPQDLDWKTMLDSGKVTLIDPLTVMRCPYSVIQDM